MVPDDTTYVAGCQCATIQPPSIIHHPRLCTDIQEELLSEESSLHSSKPHPGRNLNLLAATSSVQEFIVDAKVLFRNKL